MNIIQERKFTRSRYVILRNDYAHTYVFRNQTSVNLFSLPTTNLTQIKTILGVEYCTLLVSKEGILLSASHRSWAGYSLSHMASEKINLLKWLTKNESQYVRYANKWDDWIKEEGKNIRIWIKPNELKQGLVPVEVRLLSNERNKKEKDQFVLLIRNLSTEWAKRQLWRNRVQFAKTKAAESYIDFAAWLHDWKTPLSTIESSTWLCIRYNGEKDGEKRMRHLKKIERSVHEMKIGMQDWQTWHQPPTLRKIERVRIFSLIQDRIEQLAPLLKNGQQIHFWHQGKNRIDTDPNAIQHIIDNLLSNASKYSPEQTQIWVRAWNMGERMQIDISDEGIGIPDHEINKLFEAKYRASNTDGIPGNGLGLSTVDRLIKQLGGSIQVSSQINNGSTFSITLKNQHLNYEKGFDHRGQSRNQVEHRRDTGIGPVSNTNR